MGCADNCQSCNTTACASIGAGGNGACFVSISNECVGSLCDNNCENCDPNQGSTCQESFAPPAGCMVVGLPGEERCGSATFSPTTNPTTEPTMFYTSTTVLPCCCSSSSASSDSDSNSSSDSDSTESMNESDDDNSDVLFAAGALDNDMD